MSSPFLDMSSPSLDGLSLTSLLRLLEAALPAVRELQKKEADARRAAERARQDQRPLDLVVALLPQMIAGERRQYEIEQAREDSVRTEQQKVEEQNAAVIYETQRAADDRARMLEAQIATLRAELAGLRGSMS